MMQDDVLTRGERTRQSILDAAERLFLGNGYNGTSMRQIAHEAGDIAVGGIYNHFGGKEDIFLALLEDRSPYRAIMRSLEDLPVSNGPEMLATAYENLQEIIVEHLQFFGLVLIDVQEFEGRTVRTIINRMIPSMMAFADRLENAGGFREEMDGIMLLRVFSSMLLGYTLTNLIAFSQEGKLMISGVPDRAGTPWEAGMIDVLLNGVAV